MFARRVEVLKENAGAPVGGEALRKSKLLCFFSFTRRCFIHICIAYAGETLLQSPMPPMINADDMSANANFGLKLPRKSATQKSLAKIDTNSPTKDKKSKKAITIHIS